MVETAELAPVRTAASLSGERARERRNELRHLRQSRCESVSSSSVAWRWTFRRQLSITARAELQMSWTVRLGTI
jgi:hypothetical protein